LGRGEKKKKGIIIIIENKGRNKGGRGREQSRVS